MWKIMIAQAVSGIKYDILTS